MKAFCRQEIPHSICKRKQTVDIDILIEFGKGDTKIMQPIGTTSVPPTTIR